jgi:mannose-6-phosphate isomerase-like protein (cupin superfamily)
MATPLRGSGDVTWKEGSCGEEFQVVWEVGGYAETIYVRYPTGAPPGVTHAHDRSAVHFVFVRGAGVVRHTDAAGRFYATPIAIADGEAWAALSLEPGSFYQVEAAGPSGLEAFMTLTPPYSAEHRRVLTEEENGARGWGFCFRAAVSSPPRGYI